jgi:hypothetical protein
VGQVYPVQGAEGVESVASTGESTCTPGLVAYNEGSSIRNVQGEGSQQGEVARDGWNEGEQTVLDSIPQVGFQMLWGYLVWAVADCLLQHPRSCHLLDSSAEGTLVTGVSVWVDHYSGFVGSPL